MGFHTRSSGFATRRTGSAMIEPVERRYSTMSASSSGRRQYWTDAVIADSLHGDFVRGAGFQRAGWRRLGSRFVDDDVLRVGSVLNDDRRVGVVLAKLANLLAPLRHDLR